MKIIKVTDQYINTDAIIGVSSIRKHFSTSEGWYYEFEILLLNKSVLVMEKTSTKVTNDEQTKENEKIKIKLEELRTKVLNVWKGTLIVEDLDA